jgi:hypothetical protein
VALFVVAVALLAFPTHASASGGRYAFDGGTAAERGQVRAALRASSFDWNVVPGTITVHIRRGIGSQATPGEVWLDADLLDSGTFAWGVVQHEFAHEVDFLLLTDADRARIQAVLGGSGWCFGAESHDDNGCERFATALSWAYWPSPRNAFAPRGEGWLSPASVRALRALLAGLGR